MFIKMKDLFSFLANGLPFNRLVLGSTLTLFIICSGMDCPEQCPPLPEEIQPQVEIKARAICGSENKISTNLYEDVKR